MNSLLLIADYELLIISGVYFLAIAFWFPIGYWLAKKKIAKILGCLIMAKCAFGLVMLPILIFLGVILATTPEPDDSVADLDTSFKSSLYGVDIEPFGTTSKEDNFHRDIQNKFARNRAKNAEDQRRHQKILDDMTNSIDESMSGLHDGIQRQMPGINSPPRFPFGSRGVNRGSQTRNSQFRNSRNDGTNGNGEEKETPPYDLKRLRTPGFALPRLRIDMKRAKRSILAGFETEDTFEDLATDKAVMVGLIVGVTEDKLNPIQHVQPVYQVEQQYQLGKLHGIEGGKQEFLEARDGYAVGGIRVSGDSRVTGIQLICLKSVNGSLQRNEFYYSKWAGTEQPNRSTHISENGKYVVGIYGYLKEDSISGIGLTSFRGRLDDSPKPAEPKPELAVRTWNSSDGQFSIAAKLVRVESSLVALKPVDGDEIEVGLALLSETDQQYVTANKAALKPAK